MFQNAHGFRFQINGLGDLTQVSALKVVFARPDGSTFTKLTSDVVSDDAVTIDDAAGGAISFLIKEGDLSQTGSYSYQVADISQGRFIPSNIGALEVCPNIFPTD